MYLLTKYSEMNLLTKYSENVFILTNYGINYML